MFALTRSSFIFRFCRDNDICLKPVTQLIVHLDIMTTVNLIDQYEQQYAVSTADFTAKIAKLASVERGNDLMVHISQL